MKLHEVIHLQDPCRVAVVGAGGKTSTIWRLADSLNGKVAITTTTHLGLDQIQRVHEQIYLDPQDELRNINWKQNQRIISITGPILDGHRLNSLTPAQNDQLFQLSVEQNFSILIEADGARMLPLKCPGKHEPVIPDWVDAVIVVAGMSALGQTLNEKSAFRLNEFSKISGIPVGERITASGIGKVLCAPDGGLKNIPEKARRIMVLNQSEMVKQQSEIMRIANFCQHAYDQILITSFGYEFPDPVIHARINGIAAIILAAGGSTRMKGQPKPLIELQGESLVWRAVRSAEQAGFSPVIVVTGFESDRVAASLEGLNVEIVVNVEWEKGQSTSIRSGLKQLGNRSSAAIFMLVDQPFVSGELLEELKHTYQTTITPIVAPIVDDHRSNPVIFDRITFTELEKLEGDTGGRAIMGHFEHTWLPWLDRHILVDIDTPEDLERYKNAE